MVSTHCQMIDPDNGSLGAGTVRTVLQVGQLNTGADAQLPSQLFQSRAVRYLNIKIHHRLNYKCSKYSIFYPNCLTEPEHGETVLHPVLHIHPSIHFHKLAGEIKALLLLILPEPVTVDGFH